MKDILFVSAFYNINRDQWKNKHKRSIDNYFESFNFLLKYIDYDIIVFIENKYMNKIKYKKKNIFIYDLDKYIDELFITKYNKIENNIINSNKYKKLLSNKTKNKPEHNFSKYNLINHDKVNFVYLSKKIFPKYNYYSWIDFGYLKERNNDDIERIPKNINFNYINNNKILYQSLVKNIEYKNSFEMLSTNKVYIQGTFWIISNNIIEKYLELYNKKLLEWHKLNIVDDDQNLVLQLIYDHPKYFDLYYNKNFFSLFKVILNKPIKSSIIKI